MLENRIGITPTNLQTPGTYFSNYKTISNNITFDTTDENKMIIGPITVSGSSTILTISGTGTFMII